MPQPSSKPGPKKATASEVDDGAAEAADADVEEAPAAALPPDLLQKLLKNFFEDEGTKISAAAVDAVGEYIRTYMREAIYRAVAERRGGNIDGTVAADGSRAGLGLMLEVDDLEKLATQLLLDF